MRIMKPTISRRTLLRGSALFAAAAVSPGPTNFLVAQPVSSSPIRLGIASYTFRNFDQAHLIEFMKELKTPYLNLKDVHLPMTPVDQVASRAAQYRDAGLKLTAAGTI